MASMVAKEGARASRSKRFVEQGGSHVGRKVRKRFGDAFFSGIVDGYDESVGWFHVSYEDGDEEELTWKELEQVIVRSDASKDGGRKRRRISRRISVGSQRMEFLRSDVKNQAIDASGSSLGSKRRVHRKTRIIAENEMVVEDPIQKKKERVEAQGARHSMRSSGRNSFLFRTARKSIGGKIPTSPVWQSIEKEPSIRNATTDGPGLNGTKDGRDNAPTDTGTGVELPSPEQVSLVFPGDVAFASVEVGALAKGSDTPSVPEPMPKCPSGSDPSSTPPVERGSLCLHDTIATEALPHPASSTHGRGPCEEGSHLGIGTDAQILCEGDMVDDVEKDQGPSRQHPKKHVLKSARLLVEGELSPRPYHMDEIRAEVNANSAPVYRLDLVRPKLESEEMEKVELPTWVFEYPEDCAEQVQGRMAVKRTLRHFHRQHMAAIREENERVLNVVRDDGKRTSRRPDLVALSKMNGLNLSIRDFQGVPGAIPGIPVGRKFYSRVEAVVVGLHGHWLQGISYVKVKGSGKAKSFSTSIVVGGNYEDDADDGDTLLYTGHGGNDLLGSRRQIADQLLERGNEALVGNLLLGIPVRVIRKNSDTSSYTKNVFIYDGLYQVESYWGEKGISGFLVYRFRLKRLPGQPDITSSEVHWGKCISSLPRKLLPSQRAGLLLEDIALGMERYMIPVVNMVDNTPAPTSIRYEECMPTGIKEAFRYITCCVHLPSVPRPEGVKPLTLPELRKLNDGKLPYVDSYRIAEPRHVVFEAASNAVMDEQARKQLSVTQHGIHYRLEVFRTKAKGWGVRSWDTIPAGAFVCEFTGEIMTQDEAETRGNDDYIFDLDCIQTAVGKDGRIHRGSKIDLNPEILVDEPEYALDGYQAGNVGRFINHSSEPNLFVQCVLDRHHDLNIPRICFFASDNIPPMTELCYDYGKDYVAKKFSDGLS